MKYNELIELYKKNELPEQQQKQIEYDIERQEAIAEYLFEKDETAAFELADDTNFGEADFTEKTNKSINRKFVKAGVISAAAAVVVILFIVFALPNIVSCFYYNPAKEVISHEALVYSDSFNQISTDFSVFSELALPGYFRNDVAVEKNGYGSYDIQIKQTISWTGNLTNVSGKITRNKLVLYDTNTLTPPQSCDFGWWQTDGKKVTSLKELYDSLTEDERSSSQYISMDKESADLMLSSLRDNDTYLAYVTLDRIMDYKDFIRFINDKNLGNVWCGVFIPKSDYYEDEMSLGLPYLGFVCNPWFGREDAGLDEYPNLFTGLDNKDELADEDFAKQHFLSMLRYMRDNKRSASVMSSIEDLTNALDPAIDYVEKNGLKIHGFAITATKDKLLKINDMKEVYAISTKEFK